MKAQSYNGAKKPKPLNIQEGFTFIEEWCDNNNFKLPKKYNSSRQQTCPIDSKDEIPALVDYFGNLFVLHHFKLLFLTTLVGGMLFRTPFETGRGQWVF